MAVENENKLNEIIQAFVDAVFIQTAAGQSNAIVLQILESL